MGAIPSHIVPTCTSQSGDLFFFSADVDPKIRRDPSMFRWRVDRAPPRQHVAGNYSLGKGAAAGITASPTVRVWQHLFDPANTRILLDVKPAIGDHKQRRQDDRQATDRHDSVQGNHSVHAPSLARKVATV
jgi:hypothetical protein